MSIQCPGGAQPHFYTAKIGNRWWLCTPAGNAFFMKGVYYVDVNDGAPDYQGVTLTTVIANKYAKGATSNSTLNWALQSVRRLKSWGFNTLNEYSSAYTWATTTDSQWTTSDHAIPERMPFVVIVRPSWYAYTNSDGYASGPVKELVTGVKTTAYTGYRSQLPDVWDPNFAQWLQNDLQKDAQVHQAFTGAHNDYLLGFDIDESDNMLGFGAGPDFPTADISHSGMLESGHTHPQIAWLVLATAPAQTSNSAFGVSYANTTVYTKQQMSAWLAARYNNNIGALNAAWGSKYTSFGSAGGFGVGTGILDEDGTCPARGSSACWMGDAITLAKETSGMQQDMSGFLAAYVSQYYSVIKKAINGAAPGYLLLGASPIGGWGAPPRREVLQAASQYLDVFTLGTIPPFICGNCTDVQQRVDFLSQYGGDKPWVNWEGFTANADSYWSVNTKGSDYVTTQQQRGELYQQMMEGLLDTKDSNGTYHIVGFEWWAFYDSRGEQYNWGLLTRRDNAYDGVQARIATGVDAWGYPTGGESTNYSDFIDAVRLANQQALLRLSAPASEISAAALARNSWSRFPVQRTFAFAKSKQ